MLQINPKPRSLAPPVSSFSWMHFLLWLQDTTLSWVPSFLSCYCISAPLLVLLHSLTSTYWRAPGHQPWSCLLMLRLQWFYLVLVVVQSPSHVQFFATPWTTAYQAPLFLTISWSLPKFMFIASMMPSSHLILWCPLLLHLVLCWQFPNLRASSDISWKHQMKLQTHTSNCLLGTSTWMSNHQVKFKCPKLSFWNFTHSHPKLLQSSPSQLKATLLFLLEKVKVLMRINHVYSFSLRPYIIVLC